MRRLKFIAVICALFFCGYWLAASIASERGANIALASLETNGWQVQYETLDTRGFPVQFETTVNGLELKTPDGRVAWAVPTLQTNVLSYLPNEVAVVFPPQQTLTLGRDAFDIQASEMRITASVFPNLALPLNTLTANLGQTRIISKAGWSLGLNQALASAQLTSKNTYSLDLNVASLAFPEFIMRAFDPTGIHPTEVEHIELHAEIILNEPLDRHLVNALQPSEALTRRVTVNDVRITWGAMNLHGEGVLEINVDGRATGLISLEIVNWRDVLALFVDAQMLEPNAATLWTTFGIGLSNDSNILELPVAFENGDMSIGFIPLGPAPIFR